MRVLLTGATGFVGLNIVQALHAAGHDVLCHVRPQARRQYLDRLPVAVVAGQLGDVPGLAAAMRGIDAVIHTAGDTSCLPCDLPRLTETNVEGTRAVLEAARRSGVRRVVYTSTTSTIGSTETPGMAADETMPLQAWRAASPYGRTKLAAETLVREARGVEGIVLNPAEVLGAWDHTLQWGRIVLAVASGRLPFMPPGSGTFAPAADVADAHVAALTRGVPGERYILGGHHLTFTRLITEMAIVTGGSAAPLSRRPYALQRLEAQLRQWLPPLAPPAVDAYRMRVFGGHHLFDDGKARQHLGYGAQPIRQAIEACFAWYREHGFLPAAPDTPINTPQWKTA
ncbi:NAD-dependent epimerase/dehydratase family protein [Chitiniphilus eburneus]|uniref:NAD-dependent epimerase/dehydratase family protein n=1 Tax=Chitiniphilus eburneus TaxID=2571148 RepID=A0A4U0Q9N6_9NEIS|nr:NAD-dependent epimerase/dehydratase family protein [Chitiniphilus eburneus]TJZ77670.1 NAD-dependent epimerase/dehydratase family protein [Chitiniphilus eburneus]